MELPSNNVSLAGEYAVLSGRQAFLTNVAGRFQSPSVRATVNCWSGTSQQCCIQSAKVCTTNEKPVVLPEKRVKLRPLTESELSRHCRPCLVGNQLRAFLQGNTQNPVLSFENLLDLRHSPMRLTLCREPFVLLTNRSHLITLGGKTSGLRSQSGSVHGTSDIKSLFWMSDRQN